MVLFCFGVFFRSLIGLQMQRSPCSKSLKLEVMLLAGLAALLYSSDQRLEVQKSMQASDVQSDPLFGYYYLIIVNYFSCLPHWHTGVDINNVFSHFR